MADVMATVGMGAVGERGQCRQRQGGCGGQDRSLTSGELRLGSEGKRERRPWQAPSLGAATEGAALCLFSIRPATVRPLGPCLDSGPAVRAAARWPQHLVASLHLEPVPAQGKFFCGTVSSEHQVGPQCQG